MTTRSPNKRALLFLAGLSVVAGATLGPTAGCNCGGQLDVPAVAPSQRFIFEGRALRECPASPQPATGLMVELWHEDDPEPCDTRETGPDGGFVLNCKRHSDEARRDGYVGGFYLSAESSRIPIESASFANKNRADVPLPCDD